MPSFNKQFSRILIVFLGAALGLTLSATAASAAPSKPAGNPNATCDGTHHSETARGANQRDAYDNTCDGSPSGNGNGSGTASGKPCAGCVGNADDKNPKGNMSNGGDSNAGYECDGNKGVARSNPAHTKCRTTQPTTPPSTGGGTTTTTTTHNPPITTLPTCPAGSSMVNGACVSGGTTVKPPTTTTPVRTVVNRPPSRTAVLGVQFLRSSPMVANGEQVRAVGALASTGSNSTVDLVPLALAFVALGTLLARFGRSRRTETA